MHAQSVGSYRALLSPPLQRAWGQRAPCKARPLRSLHSVAIGHWCQLNSYVYHQGQYCIAIGEFPRDIPLESPLPTQQNIQIRLKVCECQLEYIIHAVLYFEYNLNVPYQGQLHCSLLRAILSYFLPNQNCLSQLLQQVYAGACSVTILWSPITMTKVHDQLLREQVVNFCSSVESLSRSGTHAGFIYMRAPTITR